MGLSRFRRGGFISLSDDEREDNAGNSRRKSFSYY